MAIETGRALEEMKGTEIALEDELARWIEKRCLESPPSKEQFCWLNQTFNRIYIDRRFRKYEFVSREYKRHYPTALSTMWTYFTKYLCEGKLANNGKQVQSFLETKDCAVGRLLCYLEWRLKDLCKQDQRQRQREEDFPSGGVAAPKTEVSEWFDIYCDILKKDDGNRLKNEHVRGRPDVNIQILLILSDIKKLDSREIADQLGASYGTLFTGKKWPKEVKRWRRILVEEARLIDSGAA